MSDDRNTQRRDRIAGTLLDVATIPDYTVLDPETYTDLASGIGSLFDDTRPNTDRIEAALGDVTLPETGELDVDATVLPDSVGVDAADAETVLDAGGETLAVAAETGGDAATVVVDSGGEAIEIAVENGGDVAAEAVVEVLAGALEV
jgi:hypothetical protein